MGTDTLPTLFVSHGSPTLPFEDMPARSFLGELGRSLPRPRAILAVSAHWISETPAVNSTERPETIHDFYGFPERLYALRYPAPGAPALAERVAGLLSDAGFAAATDGERGLDHGAWSPLSLIYPEADIPVAQLSVQADLDPRHHYAVGQALAGLAREGVLVMGSGGAVHNLSDFRLGQTAVSAWAQGFDDWLNDAIAEDRRDDLLSYRTVAPHAVRAHPTDEHLLPLFVAMGAAGPGGRGRALHRSFAHGSISMASFAFDPA